MIDLLAALIADLEDATEGSALLDARIARQVLIPTRAVSIVSEHPTKAPLRPCIQMYRYPNGSEGTALRYTASVDAALTLLPGDWSWRVGNTPSAAFATLGTSMTEHIGATPALALCVACLKSRLHPRSPT